MRIGEAENPETIKKNAADLEKFPLDRAKAAFVAVAEEW